MVLLAQVVRRRRICVVSLGEVPVPLMYCGVVVRLRDSVMNGEKPSLLRANCRLEVHPLADAHAQNPTL